MHECDLILKGGITSGVAYPSAIARLAKRYRLRSIGGTSAGAIAAVLAAAAEYRRQRNPDAPDANAGFDALGNVASILGRDLATLFQPVPKLRPLYQTLLAAAQAPAERRTAAFLGGLAKAWLMPIVVSTLPGILIILSGDGGWAKVSGCLIALLLPIIVVSVQAIRLIFRELPRNDFGLCTGLTTNDGRYAGKLAFTDWMHEQIESVAGERPGDGPLTAGDLKPYDITVASMTTDLSSRRPWQLPLRAGVHCFSLKEFSKLFPADVVRWLVDKGGPCASKPGTDLPSDLYHLPDGDDMPLLVLARLSLSFPGLVSAVPLYRPDDELGRSKNDTLPLRRCLFSDGGISSNFPVHLFDGFLPSRPTFGIGFASYEIERHGSQEADRVHLPKKPPNPAGGAVYSVTGIGSFLSAIINTAKDWQDTLQSRLSGYSERIVEIRLDPKREGGLHVEMDEETIARLAEFGERAASRLETDFDFDTHRFDRGQVLLPALAGSLNSMAKAYTKTGESGKNYEEVLRSHPSSPYEQDSVWNTDPFAKFIREVIVLGNNSPAQPTNLDDDATSSPTARAQDADLRIVASADTSASK